MRIKKNINKDGFRGVWIGWLVTPTLEEQKNKKNENNCEYYGQNKGKHSKQIPHCNFYSVTLLVFLVILQPKDTCHPPPLEKSCTPL